METVNCNTKLTREEALRRLSATLPNISNRYKADYVSAKVFHDLLLQCYKNIVISLGQNFDFSKEIDNIVWDCAKLLTGSTSQWGLMFGGFLGNGKTTLMKAIQRAFVCLGGAGYIPFGEGLRLVSAKSVLANYDMLKWRQQLFNEPLLGIDDLGVEPKENNVFGSICTPISDLLEYRYNRRLVTVVSTNLTKSQRLEKYSARLADRFDEMFLGITFTHKSYRQHADSN